jgi:mannose-1-phosphate guanylyltransferase / phosphomannomutase
LKALILAAGKGQRLGKITSTIPKPMIRIKGKPVLQHNIELCKNAGINNIFINTHHLPEKITDYFGNGSRFGVNIKYNHEEKILGTAGALVPFKNDLLGGPFIVIYGDNYIRFNILDLKKYNEKVKADISILFHWRDDVSNSGVASFDNNNRIIDFIEKPPSIVNKSDWVNAGYYYIDNNKIFDFIRSNNCDFSLDLIPNLIKDKYKLYALKTNENLIAIDTPKLFAKSQKY